MRKSRALAILLLLGGALLLAKGSFAVVPLLFYEPELPVVIATTGEPSHLEPGSALFRMSLPRQSVNLTVVEGTSESSLQVGPGHLTGSPLPGATGNVVIAGHRDTHFRVLKDVLIGDEIRIDTAKTPLIYRVVDIRIVSPHDTWVLESHPESTMTLITCYPFHFLGPAPDRYIVQASLVRS